jgi:hypothetical protein
MRRAYFFTYAEAGGCAELVRGKLNKSALPVRTFLILQMSKEGMELEHNLQEGLLVTKREKNSNLSH